MNQPMYLKVLLGFILGLILGVVFQTNPIAFGVTLADLSTIGLLVIRLIKILAVPLVFFAILDAVVLSNLAWRDARRFFRFALLNVLVAMGIGLTILNVFHPGKLWEGKIQEMLQAAGGGSAAALHAPESLSLNVFKNLEKWVPSSLVDPFLQNNIVVIVLLAVIFGASLRFVLNEKTFHAETQSVVRHLLHLLYRSTLKMLEWTLQLIPLAVLLVVANVVGKSGLQIFNVLAVFLGTILAGLLIHAFLYYPTIAYVRSGISPSLYFRTIAGAIWTAFSVNSSLATMPLTLKALHSLGVSENASRMSCMIGTNFNNDGITLYEAMAAMFLAQALGMSLGFPQQVEVVLASLMAGAGIAGVPEAGLVMLPLVLATTGMPESLVTAVIPLILPVDWIIARVRSVVNVLNDYTIAILIDGKQER